MSVRLKWGNTNIVPLVFEFTDPSDLYLFVGIPGSVAHWNALFNLPTAGNPFTSVSIDGAIVKLYGGSNMTLESDSTLFYNDKLVSINDPNGVIVKIGHHIFCDPNSGVNYNFESIYAPGVLELEGIYVGPPDNIYAGPFMYCYGLTYINLPKCYIIGDYSFYWVANSGTEGTLILDWDNILTIPDGEVFEGCWLITDWSFPNATYIGAYAFDNTIPTNIYIPSCTNLGGTSGNDSVFSETSGQTFTLTIPTALEFDGDVAYAQEMNDVTLVLV